MQKNIRYEKIINSNEIDFLKKHNYFILIKEFTKGEMHPSHWHDYYELEILLEGTATHSFGDKVCNLSKGNSYLITPIESHGIEFTSPAKMLNFRFNVDFLPEKLSDFMSSLNNATVNFDEPEIDYILTRLDKIFEDKFVSSFHHELIQSIISEIIILFIRKLDKKKSSNIKIPLVQQAIKIINKNFRNDLSLKEVADELSVTPKYLGSIFMKNLNINFNDYLNNLRLKYACNLLLSTDCSIKEIAYNSGYNSEQYFLYMFKKQIHLTPSEYRKKFPV